MYNIGQWGWYPSANSFADILRISKKYSSAQSKWALSAATSDFLPFVSHFELEWRVGVIYTVWFIRPYRSPSTARTTALSGELKWLRFPHLVSSCLYRYVENAIETEVLAGVIQNFTPCLGLWRQNLETSSSAEQPPNPFKSLKPPIPPKFLV